MTSPEDDRLKSRTARTLKWNVIDRLASQVLYAVTGIVLARLLSTEDFGLVGAVLVFQAFASLLVDSGFSYALIQRKNPTQTDYSTVLWFNMAVAVALYILLWFCAPLIADCFQGDRRLIPLSRVMFISFIINASAIVQTNRLMKRMDVKMVAVSNSLGLVAGAVAGIALAVNGFGAWAIVWQTITLGSVKSIVLWTTQKWLPSARFSWHALRGFLGIGSRMMLTSFLNTLFLNIYSFVIGNRAGLSQLGYYTQSDKWSKMGIMSLSQTLTSSFLPTLSAVQDDYDRFRRACSKMNRFTAYLLFPAMFGLMAMATPIFHLLFQQKWDPSIILFQILLLRGVFTVLTGLYNNFLLSQGHARTIMWMEVLRDSVALIALAACLPFIRLENPEHPVLGLELLLWGQLLAAVISWLFTLIYTSRLTKTTFGSFLSDIAPYFFESAIICLGLWYLSETIHNPLICLLIQIPTALIIYFFVNKAAGSKIQSDVIGYIRGRL
ncbi:MAG: lipopolysaccharide biosynthesis protein [Muribaculaceae bacterium]|nr:lipopolysaccharide biosynthesis protein [Muribaculaceae bacterium]